MTYDVSKDSAPKRRRQISAQALVGREAARLVKPTNARLAAFHSASIKHLTMAQRHDGAPDTFRVLVDETRTLGREVASTAAALESMVREAPEAVARHSRIHDARQSLALIRTRLHQALGVLGIHADEG